MAERDVQSIAELTPQAGGLVNGLGGSRSVSPSLSSLNNGLGVVKAPGTPSRKLRLSKFDTQGAHVTWKDDREQEQAEAAIGKVEAAFSSIIESVGDPNPDRDGLKKTPMRAAKALMYFTKGYEEDLESEYIEVLIQP